MKTIDGRRDVPVGKPICIALSPPIPRLIESMSDHSDTHTLSVHTCTWIAEDYWLDAVSHLIRMFASEVGRQPKHIILGVEAFVQVTNALGAIGSAGCMFNGVDFIVNPAAEPRSMTAVPDELAALNDKIDWQKFSVVRGPA